MENAGAGELIAGLIGLGQALAAGHVRGSGGNLSAREPGGRVWITTRGARLGALAPEHVVVVDDDGRSDGGAKPSSEWRLHLAAYRARPEANWVVHVHSTHAIALGALEQALPALTPDQYLYLGACVPNVPYQTPTSDTLANAAGQALAGGAVAVLLQNHGVLVTAPDRATAQLRVELLEESAHIMLLALSAGGGRRPAVLSAEAMRALDEATGGRYRVG